MTNLQRFAYTSRFSSEVSYDFLISKPDSLKDVTICHCSDLDMNFLEGIESLTLTNIILDDENDEEYNLPIFSLLKALPETIKHVTIGGLNDDIQLPSFKFTLESY